MSLSQLSCKACRGGVAPLEGSQLQNYLEQVPEWRLIENKISRTFTFKNFKKSFDFANEVGRISEQEDHHPDVCVHNYKNVTITLWTHKIDGLFDNDFILAAKINEIENPPATFSNSLRTLR